MRTSAWSALGEAARLAAEEKWSSGENGGAPQPLGAGRGEIALRTVSGSSQVVNEVTVESASEQELGKRQKGRAGSPTGQDSSSLSRQLPRRRSWPGSAGVPQRTIFTAVIRWASVTFFSEALNP